MNNPIAQNVPTPVTAPIAPPAAQDAVTQPAAAKGDDNLMSQQQKPS